MNSQQSVIATYKAQYGRVPKYIIEAPGRVNLIGEHTDYNDGFVLPMSINQSLLIAIEPRKDQIVRIFSADFDEEAKFSLEHFQKTGLSWIEYVKGVAWSLETAGHKLGGWNGVIKSNIPVGAGLSSSAAIEMGVALSFSTVSDFEWNPTQAANLCRQAENNWVGVSCGIMDQLIVGIGRKDHAALIDSRTLDVQHVPVPREFSVVIMDTMKRRELAGSVYNKRYVECQKAAKMLDVAALRDVTITQFHKNKFKLEHKIRKRAKHVITENQRTLKAAEAMKNNNINALQTLLNQSHQSLKDDFEVTSKELDLLVNYAQEQNGNYGARMTGAGFGGCAVAFVEKGVEEQFTELVSKKYKESTGKKPEFYISTANEGARLIWERVDNDQNKRDVV